MRLLFKISLLMMLSVPSMVNAFTLISNDIEEGKPMAKAHEYTGFGCNGANLSPHLSWTGIPKGTKSFAVTVYDPDAPTGSGWWHWQIINIPVDITELPPGAGSENRKNAIPKTVQIENDYGAPGFGGACPPAGDKPHRYQFTVYALSVEKIDVQATASGALVGYMIKSHSLASSSIESLYGR